MTTKLHHSVNGRTACKTFSMEPVITLVPQEVTCINCRKLMGPRRIKRPSRWLIAMEQRYLRSPKLRQYLNEVYEKGGSSISMIEISGDFSK